MLAQRTETKRSKNPLDALMTKTQVVRRRFKSGLPRVPQNQVLLPMAAMARTMELFDRLRGEMEAAGLDKNDCSAALVYYQPETKGMEHVLAQTVVLPKPEGVAKFAEKIMELDKPRFLGVLFHQHDPDADKDGFVDVVFAFPFLNGPDDAARLLAARNRQVKVSKKN